MREQKTPAALGFTHHDTKRRGKAMKKVKDKHTYVRLQSVLSIAEGMAA